MLRTKRTGKSTTPIRPAESKRTRFSSKRFIYVAALASPALIVADKRVVGVSASREKARIRAPRIRSDNSAQLSRISPNDPAVMKLLEELQLSPLPPKR